MQLEHFCDGPKRLETKPGTDSRFGTAGDEEFDTRNPVHIAGEDGEDGRGRFFVLALVEGVDDNESGNVGSSEGTNEEHLHLGAERPSSSISPHFQDPEQLLPEGCVLVGELESECRKDRLKVASFSEISRAEEARPEFSVSKGGLGHRLSDG